MSLGKQLCALPPINGKRYSSFINSLDGRNKSIIEAFTSCLKTIFNAAPYLADIAEKNIEFLCKTLTSSPSDILDELLTGLAKAGAEQDSEDQLSLLLRQTKKRIALLAAIAEIGKVWTPQQSTASLADLADVALVTSLDFLMRQAAHNGDLKLSPEEAGAANSGMAIFALGKHGGRELNYSSDIDIVVFYDESKNVLADGCEPIRFYRRIVRKLVALMDERTEAGYVFRTDLRLRPDPGSTPAAISVDAALAYYESRGQNWERAAWIKARPCAGDMELAEEFLKNLTPFIWRKHLDFATIADIQAMKRQINIARNVGQARVEGHNVKLGRGGIREIEFFAQTQQLIAGGRDISLRVRPTVKALEALGNANWIEKKTVEDLNEAYWYLRAVENRLQMILDEQTHSMPEGKDNIAVISALMGEGDIEKFKQQYRLVLSTVMNYYGELFIEETSLAGDIGDLVFTGTDDDPATLDTLQNIGFDDPALASATIRKWHYGSYPATRAAASRAHLTELLPKLLKTIASAGNGDEALARFDHFLSQFPAGVQLFSLLRSNRDICHTLIAFMASAPRMADAVIHRAHVMDGLIDPAFADGVTRTDVLVGKVENFLQEANSFEDLIDRARIIGQEQKFLIGAGFISGTVSAAKAGQQFTALAETLLHALFNAVQREFVKRHGRVRGANVALLAFGKMASREMTATSDLDFILLYDASASEEMSDGPRPLAASHYFSRLTQRLVAALSAPTAEGVLYEADMRLRPSGNAGPLATSLAGFIKYQMNDAWTWEHLALTRARIVVGEKEFADKISATIADILDQPFDAEKTVKDVTDMRALMAKERKPSHHFDLKLVEGGLVDIEFLAQCAQLLDREKLGVPGATVTKILAALGQTGILRDAERLEEIHATYTTILQTMSICLPDPMNKDVWTVAFKDLMAQLTNYPTFELLEAGLETMSRDVIEISGNYYATLMQRE